LRRKHSCTATLFVTFGAAGYSFGSPTTAAVRPPTYIHHTSFLGAAGSFATLILRTGVLFLLALSIMSGLIGTNSPVANINMTHFWIVFLLGFTYLTAFVGDIFELVSPSISANGAALISRLLGSVIRSPLDILQFQMFSGLS
jgi:hypothetical protein